MNVRPLLDDRYAPITSAIGFVRLPIDDAAEALAAWWRSIAPPIVVEPLSERFPDSLCRLTPLEVGTRSRALLIDQGDWTAYFDCLATGTDPVSAIGALCRLNRCDGVALVVIPDGPRREGSLQFELFGPDRTDFLNYLRSVGIANEAGRWRFDASGDPQPFEDLTAYEARRIQDRLSTAIVAKYCSTLGFRPFEPDAYGRAVLVTAGPPASQGIQRISLAERQRALGLALPGGPPCA